MTKHSSVLSEAQVWVEASDRGTIDAALSDVLASRWFKTSPQCTTLLRYIVRHTLAGEDNLLRERVIGVEVFSRKPDYEPGEDPVVRLRVSEVRKRLAQYYQLATVDVHIEIPSGGYRAVFRTQSAENAPLEATSRRVERLPELQPSPALEVPSGTQNELNSLPLSRKQPRLLLRGRLRWFLAALVAITCVASLFYFGRTAADREYQAFWAPWKATSKPILISVGSNAVYRLRYEYVDKYSKEHGLEAAGQEFYIPFKPDESIAAKDLQPAYNSFVATGDVAAISYVTTALTRQGIGFQERFPDDISFAELRNNAAVLIGGFNNPMTMELTKNLPFIMRGGSDIYDTQDSSKHWSLHVPVGTRDTADYVIVTRIVSSNDDPPLIGVAGLGGFGTLEGAKLISDPKGVEALVKTLPKDWAKKNFQAVVSIKISDFKVTSWEIVGYHVW